jgi:uncharacterized protein with HEPN domain
MSHRGDIAKLVKVIKYLSTIDKIIARYNNALETLNDIEGQPAILMCLIQIGELLNQLHDINLKEKLEVSKIVAFRNIAVHEYESILLEKTNTIIMSNLPELKLKIIEELEKEPDYNELRKFWEQQ